MQKFVLSLIFLTGFLIENGIVGDRELQQDISFGLERQNGTKLSRKKRYLVFPAGSSFQLVFCLTYPSLGVGSYFVFGHTAALAWELPSTPLFYNIKDYEKKAEEEANAETTTIEIPHDIDLSSLSHGDDHDQDHHRISTNFLSLDAPYGNLQHKIDTGYSKSRPTTYYNRQPVSIYNNPFQNFIKNSGYITIKNPGGDLKKYDNREKFHSIKGYGRNNNNYRSFNQRTSHIDPMYYSVHRRTRRDLYKKIENFLTALNLDGKTCLLKTICEVTKSSQDKENFLEEIIKTIFRIKPHDNYPSEDVYDQAANSTHNCDQMYPSCKGSVWNHLFLVKK